MGFLASPVAAQRLGGQRFAPAGSEDGILGTEGASRRELLRPYAAIWTNYALRPSVLIDEDGDGRGSPVKHVVAADLVASMAVWDGIEFGLALPVSLFSGGDDELTQSGFGRAVGIGLGDLRIRAAYRLRVGQSTSLAVHVPLLLPTSKSSDALAFGFGVQPTLALTQSLGTRVELLANASYLWREKQQVLDLTAGQELALRVAARVGIDRAWRTAALVDLGTSTSLHDAFSAASTPAEARVGVEHWLQGRHAQGTWLQGSWRLSGFVGTGLTTGFGAPDFRVGLGASYGPARSQGPRPYPTVTDRDGDGVADRDDLCPALPEDVDGFSDQDGCPDPDNDQDGIADVDDQCPRAPETKNGIRDKDGCPDRIEVNASRILTFEPVRFRFASDVIESVSFPMLQEIANVLATNPSMVVRVEGHTDWVGNDEYNLDLSKRRARSVRNFLVGHGAKDRQLSSEGFGESRPIDTNETDVGRARNRRVEFHIIKEKP